MKAPRDIDLEVTSRCNLRCRYCYFYDNPQVGYSEIPLSELKQFIDELADNRVMNIVISGGEPFIREDLDEIIRHICSKPMRFTILSNGSLITDRMASLISATRRCDYVQVSLDGSNATTHDTFRGKGSFDGAVRGIRLLKNAGVTVAVRSTIHRKNISDLGSLAAFILDDLKLPSFGTNAASFFGSCRTHESQVQLNIGERMEAMKIMLDLSHRYPGRIQAMAGPLAEAEYFRRMIDAADSNAEPFSNGGFLTGCGCIYRKLAVRSDGSYIPCLLLSELVLGRINEDPLQKIWQESPVMNELRARNSIPLETFEQCRGCRFIPYCTGNCPALAYSLTNQANHPCPHVCLRNFLAQGGSVPE